MKEAKTSPLAAESVSWFKEHCTNGINCTDDGGFHTNIPSIYLRKTEVDETVCVSGMQHLLMICGIAFSKFPVYVANGCTYALKPQDREGLTEVLTNITDKFVNFIYQTVKPVPPEQRLVLDESEYEVDDEEKLYSLLEEFMNMQVLVFTLEERETVKAKGYSLRQFTAKEVIAAARNEQWDLFLNNGSNFSNWNLHMNLAYAYSSLSVKSLVEEAYNRVFENEDASFDLEDEDEVQEMMKEFDENMKDFCQIKIKGKTVSELLDDNLHNHVRKSRGSFDKSVYADRILLIYSLVWEMSHHYNEDKAVFKTVKDRLAKYLFEKVLKDGEFTKITVESSGKVKLQTYLEMFDDYRKSLFGDDSSRAKARQKRPKPKDFVDNVPSKRQNTYVEVSSHVDALSPLATPDREVVSFNAASPTERADSSGVNNGHCEDFTDETVREASLFNPDDLGAHRNSESIEDTEVNHHQGLPSNTVEKGCFDKD